MPIRQSLYSQPRLKCHETTHHNGSIADIVLGFQPRPHRISRLQVLPNGEEISFDEVTELLKEYGVAKIAFRQGKRDYAASESTSSAIRRNLTNGALAFSSGYGALMGLAFWFFEEDVVLSTVYIASVSAWGAYHFQRLLAKQRKFRERADRKFSITAQKLNEAIQLVNSN